MSIETENHPVPSQPDRRKEESGDERRDPFETAGMRLPFRYRICPVPDDSSFHHHNRLGVILADVLYGAGGAFGCLRGGDHRGG